MTTPEPTPTETDQSREARVSAARAAGVPLVSVGIVCWNSGKDLPGCLRGVFSQTYPALEVILVDNASTDGSAEWAEKTYPQLAIARNRENLGFTRAQNQAIRMSKGAYYMPLNPDVTLEPDFVSEMVSALEKRPDFGYANGLVYLATDDPECENVVYSTGHLLARNGLACNRHFLRQIRREDLEEGGVGGANGACPLYRRAMLDDIAVAGEYFDETFFMYWEDVDLDWRAHLMGWRCWFTPRAVARHVMEATGGATSPRGRARIAVNRWLMLVKVIDLSLFVRHLPYILWLDWARTRRILCDCPKSFLYLHKGLLGNVWRSFRKRRMIQRRRRWSAAQILEWQERNRQELERTESPEPGEARFTRRDGRLQRTERTDRTDGTNRTDRSDSRARPESCSQKDESFDVVCVSHIEWRHIWQRNQHVMSRLARQGKVLFCFPVKQRLYRRCWRDVLRGVRETESGVYLWYAPVFPGTRLSKWIERFNAWFLSASLRRLQARLGIRRPVLWFYFPDLVFLAGRLGERAVVYDIQDDYAHFEWASPKIVERERTLLERADRVFTGTHALCEKHRAAARRADQVSPVPHVLREESGPTTRRIRFVPNGVDFEAFHSVRATPLPIPAEHASALGGIPGPVMGYFGLIDERVDIVLIAELARRRPEWTFLMVGPRVANEKIETPPNVRFTGRVAYADLPAVAQRFDVCLMPFVMNELTAAINPTKTLEYFALERPVVSAPIPDLVRFYGDVIEFAQTPDEWEEGIARALRPDPPRLAKALEMARGRSWDETTETFRREIGESLRESSR